MRKQLHDWRILVDCILDKVFDYIDEFDSWGQDAVLWVEGNTATVNLGMGFVKYPGEGRPAILFTRLDDDGDRHPDIGYIEDYAYQWFDFRQA